MFTQRWLPLTILLLALVPGLALFATHREQPRPLPQTHRQVVERLRAAGMTFRAIPSAPRRVYLTTREDLTDFEASNLPASPRVLGRWRGTVLVEVESSLKGQPPFDEEGEWLLRRGPLVFFGDPDMIRQIGAVLDE